MERVKAQFEMGRIGAEAFGQDILDSYIEENKESIAVIQAYAQKMTGSANFYDSLLSPIFSAIQDISATFVSSPEAEQSVSTVESESKQEVKQQKSSLDDLAFTYNSPKYFKLRAKLYRKRGPDDEFEDYRNSVDPFVLVLPRNRVGADESLNEGSEQRVAPPTSIVNKLEKTNVSGQAFLRNATVRPKPTPQ